MTVVVIITIMTTVLLLQQKKFDSSTLLRSLAYSVALTVRQAQVYGTSVRHFNSSDTTFSYNYGVFFFSGALGASNYYLFADGAGGATKDNCRAGGTTTGTCSNNAGAEDVQQFKLGSGYSIVKFCGITSSGTQTCTPDISWLSIYFKRPNTDAFFASSAGGNYASAYVQVSGPGGETRSITITSTGQIAVGALGT
jgi:hypothetical protein